MPKTEAINFITTMREWGCEIVSKTDDISGVTLRAVLQNARIQEQTGWSPDPMTDNEREMDRKRTTKKKYKSTKPD